MIACIMLLKPMLARSPRDNKCFLGFFFLNNSNKKMLAPYAVHIAVIISSLITSLCFTFAEPFDDIFLFVKSSCDWSAQIPTKVSDPRKE